MTLGLTTPDTQPPPGITRTRFSPIRFRSPLLTESLLFSLPAGTEMFHFPAFPLTAYTFSGKSHTTTACGVSPFGHPGLTAWLSAPPGLSQIPTSFIGSYCQGIHHAPLNTYTHNRCKPPEHKTTNASHRHKNKDARVHYAVPKQQPPPPSPQHTVAATKSRNNQDHSPHDHSPENPTAHQPHQPTQGQHENLLIFHP